MHSLLPYSLRHPISAVPSSSPKAQWPLKLLPKGHSARVVVLKMLRHRASAIRFLAPPSSPSTHCCLLQNSPRQILHRAKGATSHQRGRLLFHIPCSVRAADMSSSGSSGHLPSSRVSIHLPGHSLVPKGPCLLGTSRLMSPV